MRLTPGRPLTNLQLSIDAQRAAHAAIHRLAHEYAGGRWLLTGEAAPETMTEDAPGEFVSFDDGYNPADPVEQAIMATRKAVFSLHGLMP